MAQFKIVLDRILKEAIVAHVETESIEGPTYFTGIFSHHSLSTGIDSMPGFFRGGSRSAVTSTALFRAGTEDRNI